MICEFFQFKQISQAYEVLSTPEKRAVYDKGGEQALKEGGANGAGGSNPMDIFDMFFRSAFVGSRHGSSGERRSKDVLHQLSVSLEDLYKGAVRKLALEKNIICDKCEGTFCFINFIIFNYFFSLNSFDLAVRSLSTTPAHSNLLILLTKSQPFR